MASSAEKALILVTDDEKAIRDALRLILEYEGYRIIEASDGEEALSKLSRQAPDAVLLDIRMPKMNGLDVLKRIRTQGNEIPVLMISGHGNIDTALEALRLGAQDFLEKPLERDVVLRRLETALEQSRLLEQAAEYQAEEDLRWRMVGDGPAMSRVREMIRRAGPTQATVLITGESGTGKELVARATHRASTRVDFPFIKVNCAAIPDDLIESELFGHEKGSFTGASSRQKGRFARAHRGTIFLDEIGDMSLKTQAKVLRALQEGEIEPIGAGGPIQVDVRVIAATNKDLKEEIENGNFREDLYYRLSVLPIHIPPLRERVEDIKALAEHLSKMICRQNNFKERTFTAAAIEKLSAMTWKGNVRELRNYLERAIILSAGDVLDAEDLPSDDIERKDVSERLPMAKTLREFKDLAERAYLLRKLEENGWNITRTAQSIDTPRSNLYKRIEHHSLDRLAAASGGDSGAEEQK